MGPEQMQSIVQRYVAWRAKVQQDGRTITGHKLRDNEGRVVIGKGGGLKVSDGPFAEANEVMLREFQPTPSKP